MSISQLTELPVKKVEYGNLTYLIDEEKKLAYVSEYNKEYQDVIIPTSINYNSQEYIITAILTNSFKRSELKSIQFSPDSKLQYIEKQSF